MSEIDTSVEFTSTVFPTEADMKLWNSLSADQQRAHIVAAEEAGFKSGTAPTESMEDRLERVRAQSANAL